MINELAGRLNKEGKDIAASPVSAAQLGAILDLIAAGTISGKIAKDLFEIVWTEGGDPRAIVEARGMKQVTDLAAIEKVVDDIIASNPDKVGAGEGEARKLIGWFVGQVMKASGGKANPQAVNELLKSKLGALTRARGARARRHVGKTASRESRRDASCDPAERVACRHRPRRANHSATRFARFAIEFDRPRARLQAS